MLSEGLKNVGVELFMWYIGAFKSCKQDYRVKCNEETGILTNYCNLNAHSFP
jgi:hypothetical protein